ncbi:MAG TPA: PEP-utilizing enzyme [Candidatus Limnocylindrales bacterium]|nr:PEP-utilizing enzyme [Candidatus Limnocylindrales bacterium]
MTSAVPDAFPIAWREPADPDLTWEWDDMHTPRALTPLGEDYIDLLTKGFAYRYAQLDVPIAILVRVWNGYAYFAFHIDAPEAERDAVLARYTDARRTRIPLTAAYWRDEAVPELKAMYREIDEIAVDGLPADRLAVAWERAWTHGERAWAIHFYVITGPYQVLDDLADQYEAVVGKGTAGEALRLIAGLGDDLRLAEEGLERLTSAAAESPVVADRLRTGEPATKAEIEGLAGSAAFVAELEGFLTVHGHLGQIGEDLGEASWAEDAGPLLADIGKRLERPPAPAAERWAARAAEAEAIAGRVRRLLADRSADLAAFETVLAAARAIGPLTEGHNYWIDRMCADRLRRFAFRVGRRLEHDGLVDMADDITFLSRAEVPAVLLGSLDARPLVADRRREHARRQALQPPRVVGKPKEPSTEVDRFEGARFEPDRDGTLRGTGASAGIARGRARVVLGPADFGRVERGDIIVAAASNPGWVPLYSLAAGFVTDTGGVLSHAAVVAREFGLPAVVGMGDATTRIPDGRMIEIDGAAGRVRFV